MQVLLIKNKIIYNYELPLRIDGSYLMVDISDISSRKTLINLEANNNKWLIKNNDNLKIIFNNQIFDQLYLEEYQFYELKIEDEECNTLMYCIPSFEKSFQKFIINKDTNISIGNNTSNQLIYQEKYVNSNHCILSYVNGNWNLQALENSRVYVNNVLATNQVLQPGDMIFIMGLKILLIGNMIVINNPQNKLKLNCMDLSNLIIDNNDISFDENTDLVVYKKNEYFLRAPRFKTKVERETIEIDSPTQKEKEDNTPMIYTIGPMITMGMTSMVTAFVAVNNVMNNGASWNNAMPTLIMSGAMLCSMILWPILSKRYQKKQRIKNEKIRREKYTKYIVKRKNEINKIIDLQKQIIISNNQPLDVIKSIILTKNEKLWERTKDDDDFLSLSMGIGNQKPEIEIKYPEKHFEIDEDDLKDLVDKLVVETKDIVNVPITLPLTKNNLCAIVGKNNLVDKFIENLILQIIAYHSYEEVKLVILTNDVNSKKWESIKVLPHNWTDDKQMRFFASNNDEMQQISNYLVSIFRNRKYKDGEVGLNENNLDYKSFSPYYIIITDNLKNSRKLKIIDEILDSNLNIGFSLLIKNDKLTNLPDGCNTFINIGEKVSGLFENELIKEKQKIFNATFNNDNIYKYCYTLSNTPIEFEISKKALPNVLGFLEMYEVGKVEQLNVIDRWNKNNPTKSLQVPVGIDENGELFKLDLHEKFHGPHGLIAGMTGSGKSEFIITYILSLAVNYHPNEVAFVLIDYKGGGLAGAFENKETGIKLPHLVGTITNLDKIEINRALASIESELKRRQNIFNIARDKTGESTIDIYKYQRLFRDGLVDEPLPHLFIISDEFAELKSQQPEFMDQLISTARIGRSLGIHLILATQKPAGVVNDQIWSNSKFRVCLKVQEKADSMDMIKCPDAAALKETGRFYLQVGYNEFFGLGQSAWCGKQYIESEKLVKQVNTAIDFVDNVGSIIKSVDNKKDNVATTKGEELPNILKYLINVSSKENIKVRKLWLDSIPKFIYVNNLKEKYNYKKNDFIINPIIGEYDNPNNQYQGLLTLPLTEQGNTILYGMSGSGKDNFLTTLIYSTITTYSPDEVNIYAMDFGAETLRNFMSAPQVGDIILSNDKEKIENLFKMINDKIVERKKMFINFNGTYLDYIKTSGKTLPNIIIIINLVEAFNELYGEYGEILTTLSREGAKYGITFILTTNAQNNIRYKLSQNFKQQLCLQLNDEYDYRQILGKTEGVIPSKIIGRGLVKLDNVYEFQTAYPCEKDKINEIIKSVCKMLKEKYKINAKKIPVLPENVSFEYVSSEFRGMDNIPVGVEKDSLCIKGINFNTNNTNIISSSNLENTKPFVETLLYELSTSNSCSVIVMDAIKLFEKNIVSNISYSYNNFNDIIDKIKSYSDSIYEIYNNNDVSRYKNIVLVIIGLNKMLGKIDDNSKKIFEEILKTNKDTLKVNVIIIDISDELKKLEYETWFKEYIPLNNAIWVGDNILDQYTIKLTNQPRELRDSIGNDFGYVIINGTPKLVKLIKSYGIDE